MSVKICILSESEAQKLERFGVKPDCAEHPHIPRKDISALTEGKTPSAVRVGRNRICMVGNHTWKKRHSGARSVYGGPLFPVMQLIR